MDKINGTLMAIKVLKFSQTIKVPLRVHWCGEFICHLSAHFVFFVVLIDEGHARQVCRNGGKIEGVIGERMSEDTFETMNLTNSVPFPGLGISGAFLLKML